jgi:hypothetical protein
LIRWKISVCLLTGEQLLGLGNFGKKSLEDVRTALQQHSLSLRAGAADSRLLVSSVNAWTRFNIGLSVSRRDRESLAGYTLCEIHRIAEHLEQIRSRVRGRTRNHLLRAIGHLAILRQVHQTVVTGAGSLFSAREAEDLDETQH